MGGLLRIGCCSTADHLQLPHQCKQIQMRTQHSFYTRPLRSGKTFLRKGEIRLSTQESTSIPLQPALCCSPRLRSGDSCSITARVQHLFGRVQCGGLYKARTSEALMIPAFSSGQRSPQQSLLWVLKWGRGRKGITTPGPHSSVSYLAYSPRICS